jgi:hypothetical protein
VSRQRKRRRRGSTKPGSSATAIGPRLTGRRSRWPI